MMIPKVTFDDLYPNAGVYYDTPTGVFKAPADGVCWVCYRRTFWVSLAFEAPICSAVCDNVGWIRYLSNDNEQTHTPPA